MATESTQMDSYYHADVKAWKGRWQRVRDCVAGGDAIRRACFRRGRRGMRDNSGWRGLRGAMPYIPPLLDEKLDAYRSRVMRGLWYDATARTLDAWLGALLRKGSHLQLPPATEPDTDNIDLAGTPYDSFKLHLAAEILTTGRVGVWQDFSASGRPYWVKYPAENILSWSQRVLPDGRTVTELVVLFEVVSKRVDQGFSLSATTRLRVLELDPKTGNYTVRIFEEAEAGIEENDSLRAVPTISGRPMKEIPFVVFGPNGLGWHCQRSPLLAVADANLDHFRLDVDLKNALSLNCLGTMFISGVYDSDLDKVDWPLGPGIVHKLAPGGSAEIVSGAVAVEPVAQEKAADENRMATLGARMLMRPKRAAETAESLQIQASGESSALRNVADTMTQGLTKLWQWHVQWKGGTPDLSEVADTMSMDFESLRMPAADVDEQFRLQQAGVLSAQTLLENLYEGEWIRHDADEEKRRVAEDRKANPPPPAAARRDPYSTGLPVPAPDKPVPPKTPKAPPTKRGKAPNKRVAKYLQDRQPAAA